MQREWFYLRRHLNHAHYDHDTAHKLLALKQEEHDITQQAFKNADTYQDRHNQKLISLVRRLQTIRAEIKQDLPNFERIMEAEQNKACTIS